MLDMETITFSVIMLIKLNAILRVLQRFSEKILKKMSVCTIFDFSH
jgi:hypothetical protein